MTDLPIEETPPLIISDEGLAIAGLAKHASWAVLRARFEREFEGEIAKVGRGILRGGAGIDQRALDKRYGYWLGVRAVLDEPEKAARLLRGQEENRE